MAAEEGVRLKIREKKEQRTEERNPRRSKEFQPGSKIEERLLDRNLEGKEGSRLQVTGSAALFSTGASPKIW